MKSDNFENSCQGLRTRLEELPEESRDGPAAYLSQVHLDGAHEDIRDAQAESRAGNIDDAWFHLVRAAEAIGYLRGVGVANWLNTPKQGVVELLRKNGGMGGTTKGRNAEQKRDEVAKALIAAAPDGKWPSKTALELQYHNIVRKVPGFSETEHQRRKIMSRPDIKAELPPDAKRKRY